MLLALTLRRRRQLGKRKASRALHPVSAVSARERAPPRSALPGAVGATGRARAGLSRGSPPPPLSSRLPPGGEHDTTRHDTRRDARHPQGAGGRCPSPRASPVPGPDPGPGLGPGAGRRWGGPARARPRRAERNGAERSGAERANSGRGKERGGGSGGGGGMAARPSAGDGAVRRAAEQWLLWDKVRGGGGGPAGPSLPRGEGGCRGGRGLPVTQGLTGWGRRWGRRLVNEIIPQSSVLSGFVGFLPFCAVA